MSSRILQIPFKRCSSDLSIIETSKVAPPNITVLSDPPQDSHWLIRNVLSDSVHEETRGLVIANLDKVVDAVSLWRKCLPDCKPFYAVKVCDEEYLLRILANLGVGFDCASTTEVDLVLRLGVSPGRIIHTHPNKSEKQLQQAKDRGVPLFSVDCVLEAEKILKVYPEVGLLIRIRVEKFKSSYALDQFGADDVEQNNLIGFCRENSLCLKGVAFHVGCRCADLQAYERAIAQSKKCFEKMWRNGFYPTILDLGSGFTGSSYENPSFEEAAEVVKEALAKHFGDVEDLQVIAEPGRLFSAQFHTHAVRITSHKVSKNEQNFYYANDGLQGVASLFLWGDDENPFLMDADDDKRSKHICTILSSDLKAVYPIPAARPAATDRRIVKASLFGPSQSKYDVIFDGIEMPELLIGDWLIIHEIGAYSSTTLRCRYNGNGEPEYRYFISQCNSHLLNVN